MAEMTAQLKALAEAAQGWEWLCDDPGCGCREAMEAFQKEATPERILALIAENERLRGVLDEIATINSLTATQPQFIRYLQNTAQAALCHGKDPDSCWNTRCNLGHKCRSALGETK